MSALELLESLPGPDEPYIRTNSPARMTAEELSLLKLRLIELDALYGNLPMRRTILGNWLLAKIKEQDA